LIDKTVLRFVEHSLREM